MKDYTKAILLDLINRMPDLKFCRDNILLAVQCIIHCYREGNKLLTCGNGGSASDAQHIVGELMKSFVLTRVLPLSKQKEIRECFPNSADYLIENLQVALPAISLIGETALTTAYANDVTSDLSFAQQVLGYGSRGDILIAFSTSGNSNNVLYASQVAKVQGMTVIAFTGEKGGKLRELADIIIDVPSDETYRIQEYHLPIYHALCMAVEYEFFGEE
ncbi:D-sedoheptulose-7-phosphate isomerase [Desulforamulus aquiferis]|uniref:SIS domain-containing protein n=1 Tax=Desulforamulus aquiferis TaxID=1397668 RepID=A0AAW7ZCB7_9FIRM|nr:SIS domain-containing protein [Desulforamulus aquiferis]MDO7786864.1 SIS domain-containing protein [Desulforamulus aquiferis]